MFAIDEETNKAPVKNLALGDTRSFADAQDDKGGAQDDKLRVTAYSSSITDHISAAFREVMEIEIQRTFNNNGAAGGPDGE
jgi:hypothetical protein